MSSHDERELAAAQDEIEMARARRAVYWEFVGDVCAESLAPAIVKYRRALVEQGMSYESADRLAAALTESIFNRLVPDPPDG